MKFVLALLFLAGLAFAEPESEASADPEAWYYGHYGYGLGGYYGGYYGYPGYYGYGYYGRKKREADPAVLATTHAAPAVVPHLGYGLGLGYAYGAPLLHGAVPHTYTVAHKDATVTPGKVEVDVKTAPLVYAAHHVGYPYAYGHLGGYYGLPLLAAAPAAAEEPAAVEARKKREAEAEADPESWYYGYYGHGYGGYYGLGYGRYYGGYYGYPGYGYAYYG